MLMQSSTFQAMNPFQTYTDISIGGIIISYLDCIKFLIFLALV